MAREPLMVDDMHTTHRRFVRVLNLLAAAGVAAAMWLPLVTNGAPVGSWFGSLGEIASQPHQPLNTGEWMPWYGDEHPGCSPVNPGHPTDVLALDTRPEPARISFAEAWERAHNGTHADDVWVVGWCA